MAAEPSGPRGTAKSPKQLAAEARASSEAAEKRRERLIRIVGSVVVLAVVAGLIAIGFFAGRDGGSGSSATAAPTPDPTAALPTGVDPQTFGAPYGTGWTSADSDKLPTLEIWEDFQCPACSVVEERSGDHLKKAADEGRVKLLFRPAIFLDNGLTAKNNANGNPISSARATSAWGCAIDAGKTSEYHAAVFAAQPADEGVGFSDQQLIDLGAQVGISGDDLATFTTCVQDRTYLAWGANSQEKFNEAGVGGTPTGYLNGVELDSSQLMDLEGLDALIAGATAP